PIPIPKPLANALAYTLAAVLFLGVGAVLLYGTWIAWKGVCAPREELLKMSKYIAPDSNSPTFIRTICWITLGVILAIVVGLSSAVLVGPVGGHAWTIVGVAAMAATVAAVSLRKKRPPAVTRLRIVRIPPGEPPEWVRCAWVGLELPLAPGEIKARRVTSVGVLSGEGPELGTGYLVDGGKAVARLAAHAPPAAAWWRENARHVVSSGYQLFFPAEVCEKVTDGAPQTCTIGS